MENFVDSATNKPWQRIRVIPVFINYNVRKDKYEKLIDSFDSENINIIANLLLPTTVPNDAFPIKQMYHGSRLAPKGFTRIHHLFLPRAIQALGRLWEKAISVDEARLRNMLLFFVEQAVWGMSVLARYTPTHYSQVNQYLNGVYYVPSQHAECSPWYVLDGKLKRLVKAFKNAHAAYGNAVISTGTTTTLALPNNTVDYIFTDPPFGENIYYADLNFLVESWHRVWTNAQPEAIIDKAKGKELSDYQFLMQRCFQEYYRVLKPGRWMTVVFHNSRNAVWNAIQEAMLSAGFVVADVRTLDKQQGSYRQVTSTAVKQDLVISAYKPSNTLEERFKLESGTEEAVWEFVHTHLQQLPVFVSNKGQAEAIAERMHFLLFDRMVAFHVQRGVAVPMSAAEFYAGLEQRFSKREDMYFLPEQVAEYDRKRMTAKEVLQLQLFVTDESSAIQWLRQQLLKKPQTFQELQPQFLREIAGWSKNEKPLELSDLLNENFLCYKATGSIPPQIFSWLKQSAIHREKIREIEGDTSSDSGLDTSDTGLLNAAKDRYYIPNPNQAGDLEKLKERNLLKEFEEYRQSKQKQLKVFRLEAVRAGFGKAWKDRNYQIIVDVARKIPENVLQEDSKLLMFYDNAVTKLGED